MGKLKKHRQFWAGLSHKVSYPLLSLVILVLIACPESVEDPDPPDKPLLVAKSLPEAWDERGIDADNTGKNQIVLMWHPNSEKDLAGYAIFRADTLITNRFVHIANIDLFHTMDTDTIYNDDSLKTYIDYFYFIKARDNAGNLSAASDTVSYRLLQAPYCIAPIDTTTGDNFTFKWMDRASQYTYSIEYLLRLDNVNLNQTVWVCRFTNTWYGYENNTPIPFPYFPSEQSGPSNLLYCDSRFQQLPAGVYRWKVKAISEVDNHTTLDEASGESEWVFFTIE